MRRRYKMLDEICFINVEQLKNYLNKSYKMLYVHLMYRSYYQILYNFNIKDNLQTFFANHHKCNIEKKKMQFSSCQIIDSSRE